MKKELMVLLLFCLFGTMLIACEQNQNAFEVTRLVPQKEYVTQVVTRIVTQEVYKTITVNPDAELTKTSNTQAAEVINPSTNDNGLVIVQYFSLLGLHEFDKAYNLLGEKYRSYYKSQDEYINRAKTDYINNTFAKNIAKKRAISGRMRKQSLIKG